MDSHVRGVNAEAPRTVLITGGGRGIGRAVALAFARCGDQVAIASRTESEASGVACEVNELGGAALALPGDVADPEAISGWCERILERFGKIDVLVNNAGVSPVQEGGRIPIQEITLAEWERVVAVNLTGPFLLSRQVLPSMIRSGGGAIVNVASASARHGGFAAGAHYVASKAGLVGLTKVLAREGGPYGIRVNAVAPGRVATSMLDTVAMDPTWAERNVPLGRMGMPDDIAEVVVFLASDAGRYITGATVDVNGGWVMY